MKDHEAHSRIPMTGHLKRRDFLKMAGALGISVGTLEALLTQQAAYAAALDITSGLVGYWKLDEGSGTSVSDASGNNNGGSLQNGPAWTSGKIGTALSFNGSSTSVLINKGVLNTASSYSVAAWVQLSDLGNWSTAVSQDGSNISGFFLQYTSPAAPGDGGKFAFSVVSSDSTSGTSVRATSPFSPIAHTWYHLVGVYDAGSNQIKLYVNGALVGTRSVSAAWNATGNTAIGRAKWGGGLVDFWTGSVKAITGIARIDGAAYVFFGAPGGIGTTQNMTQTQLEVTSTQSRYTFQGGGVTLYVNFLSPVETNDLQRLSIPFGTIFVQAQSNDSNAHTVSVYLDISGEWAHGSSSTLINWSTE
jgi:hypothetical protein